MTIPIKTKTKPTCRIAATGSLANFRTYVRHLLGNNAGTNPSIINAMAMAIIIVVLITSSLKQKKP